MVVVLVFDWIKEKCLPQLRGRPNHRAVLIPYYPTWLSDITAFKGLLENVYVEKMDIFSPRGALNKNPDDVLFDVEAFVGRTKFH